MAKRKKPRTNSPRGPNGAIAAKDQGLGDAAIWIVEGKTPDGGGAVLRNKKHSDSIITIPLKDLDHSPRQTVKTIPPISGTVEGKTTGHWEYIDYETT